jgi:hypothetical protein
MRQALPEPVETVQQNVPLSITFRAKRSGELSAIQMPAIVDWQANVQPKTLQLVAERARCQRGKRNNQ